MMRGEVRLDFTLLGCFLETLWLQVQVQIVVDDLLGVIGVCFMVKLGEKIVMVL